MRKIALHENAFELEFLCSVLSAFFRLNRSSWVAVPLDGRLNSWSGRLSILSLSLSLFARSRCECACALG